MLTSASDTWYSLKKRGEVQYLTVEEEEEVFQWPLQCCDVGSDVDLLLFLKAICCYIVIVWNFGGDLLHLPGSGNVGGIHWEVLCYIHCSLKNGEKVTNCVIIQCYYYSNQTFWYIVNPRSEEKRRNILCQWLKWYSVYCGIGGVLCIEEIVLMTEENMKEEEMLYSFNSVGNWRKEVMTIDLCIHCCVDTFIPLSVDVTSLFSIGILDLAVRGRQATPRLGGAFCCGRRRRCQCLVVDGTCYCYIVNYSLSATTTHMLFSAAHMLCQRESRTEYYWKWKVLCIVHWYIVILLLCILPLLDEEYCYYYSIIVWEAVVVSIEKALCVIPSTVFTFNVIPSAIYSCFWYRPVRWRRYIVVYHWPHTDYGIRPYRRPLRYFLHCQWYDWYWYSVSILTLPSIRRYRALTTVILAGWPWKAVTVLRRYLFVVVLLVRGPCDTFSLHYCSDLCQRGGWPVTCLFCSQWRKRRRSPCCVPDLCIVVTDLVEPEEEWSTFSGALIGGDPSLPGRAVHYCCLRLLRAEPSSDGGVWRERMRHYIVCPLSCAVTGDCDQWWCRRGIDLFHCRLVITSRRLTCPYIVAVPLVMPRWGREPFCICAIPLFSDLCLYTIHSIVIVICAVHYCSLFLLLRCSLWSGNVPVYDGNSLCVLPVDSTIVTWEKSIPVVYCVVLVVIVVIVIVWYNLLFIVIEEEKKFYC